MTKKMYIVVDAKSTTEKLNKQIINCLCNYYEDLLDKQRMLDDDMYNSSFSDNDELNKFSADIQNEEEWSKQDRPTLIITGDKVKVYNLGASAIEGTYYKETGVIMFPPQEYNQLPFILRNTLRNKGGKLL